MTGCKLDIDPVVLPKEELQANLLADHPQVESLVREGLVVYDRPGP